MTLREHVALSSLTTLRTGGAARFVADCVSEDDVTAAFAFARERGLSSYVLGDGSNVLASDEGYEGVIIRPHLEGISFDGEGSVMEACVGAGVVWDAFVRAAAARGFWGIENLAGIPGTTGAAPVQNIGAYGTEVRDTISFVDAISRETGEPMRLSSEQCAFGYRDSRFKRTQDLLIVRVGFKLRTIGSPHLAYGDLARANEQGSDVSTPGAVGDAVRSIRAKKFPDLATCGTAGSFFKNPVVSASSYEALHARFPDLPSYPAQDGVKVPLAFILDKVLNLRGHRIGAARLFEAQPLVLVLDMGGTAHDVEMLAQDVATRVFEATGIVIEREVRSLP